MSSLYSVWDIVSHLPEPFSRLFLSEISVQANSEKCDDLILRKINSSDASQFAKRYGGSSQCWGVIWSIISVCFMVGGIVAGIAAFPQSFEEQDEASKKFIST